MYIYILSSSRQIILVPIKWFSALFWAPHAQEALDKNGSQDKETAG